MYCVDKIPNDIMGKQVSGSFSQPGSAEACAGQAGAGICSPQVVGVVCGKHGFRNLRGKFHGNTIKSGRCSAHAARR